MKYLKLFEQQTESEIAKICEEHALRNWSINSEGLVDVDDDVILVRMMSKLPLRFGKVTGNFKIVDNALGSLKGAPRVVGGDFLCKENLLVSLVGGPEEVGGSFACWSNLLTSLEGAPRKLGGSFLCSRNSLLTSLRGLPKKIYGTLSCEGCNLTTLQGCPEEISHNFDCHSNKLTTLEGGPKIVDGDFLCYNNKLITLRFAPEFINGHAFVINPIKDIPEKYLNNAYLELIIKEQYDWSLYRKDGTLRLDRLEQLIEWGIETNKIKPIE